MTRRLVVTEEPLIYLDARLRLRRLDHFMHQRSKVTKSTVADRELEIPGYDGGRGGHE
jgi:hypothetical protein